MQGDLMSDTCFGCKDLSFIENYKHRFGCWFCGKEVSHVIGKIGEVLPFGADPYVVYDLPMRKTASCWRYYLDNK